MQALKTFVCLLSCLLLLDASLAGEVAKFDTSGTAVEKASQCLQIAIEAGSYIAVRIIPLVKDAAKCTGFRLQDPQSLEPEYIMLMIYAFLHKLAENEKCMTIALDTGRAHLEPYVNRFMDMNCLAKA